MRTSMLIVTFFGAALVGCGGHPDAGAKQTRLQVEEHAANRGLQPSGRPEAPFIDPQKKTVVVLAAPSAPQLVARQQAQLTAEHEKAESQIHDLMERYTDNTRDAQGVALSAGTLASVLAPFLMHAVGLGGDDEARSRTAPGGCEVYRE